MVVKVARTSNPADMGTKHVAVSVRKKHCELVGLGGDSGSYQRRHHTQSANSVSTTTTSTRSIVYSSSIATTCEVPSTESGDSGTKSFNRRSGTPESELIGL
eukprot:3061132-Amphidinium_carterae.1